MAKKPKSFGSGPVKKMAGGGGAQSGQRAERGGGSANSAGNRASSGGGGAQNGRASSGNSSAGSRSTAGSASTGNKAAAGTSSVRAERGGGSANSVGKSSGSSSAGAKPSAAPSKASAPAKSLAPATSPRPMAKPDVVAVGSGKDKAYLDTRTGVKTAAPSYSAFSLKGLTSSDPANVARNRAGVERLNRLDAQRELGASRGDGPAMAAKAAATPATTTPTATTPVAPKAPPRVYTPAPAGYRPGIDPEWNYYQAAPAAAGVTGMGLKGMGTMLLKKGGKVKPKGKK